MTLLGMDPQRVDGLAGRLRAHSSQLTNVAAGVDRAVTASSDPASWGILPGGTVIAPFSIGTARAAAAQVRAAVAAISDLATRVASEVAEQVATSSDGARSSGPSAGPVGDPDEQPTVSATTVPGWLVHPAWGITGRFLDIAQPPGEALTWGKNAPRTWVFARQQWVNRGDGYYRYRTGLLQWGRSTYKNNPVVIVDRQIKPPAWVTRVGTAMPRWAGIGVKALGPVGLGITAVTSGTGAWQQQWDESSDLSDGDRHVRAGVAAAAVGGLSATGAAGGAWVGVQLGATIGSIFPGPGTAIGAVVGGIIGGIVGSGVGEALGNLINDLG
jgi:hypothetical protein